MNDSSEYIGVALTMAAVTVLGLILATTRGDQPKHYPACAATRTATQAKCNDVLYDTHYFAGEIDATPREKRDDTETCLVIANTAYDTCEKETNK